MAAAAAAGRGEGEVLREVKLQALAAVRLTTVGRTGVGGAGGWWIVGAIVVFLLVVITLLRIFYIGELVLFRIL